MFFAELAKEIILCLLPERRVKKRLLQSLNATSQALGAFLTKTNISDYFAISTNRILLHLPLFRYRTPGQKEVMTSCLIIKWWQTFVSCYKIILTTTMKWKFLRHCSYKHRCAWFEQKTQSYKLYIYPNMF